MGKVHMQKSGSHRSLLLTRFYGGYVKFVPVKKRGVVKTFERYQYIGGNNDNGGYVHIEHSRGNLSVKYKYICTATVNHAITYLHSGLSPAMDHFGIAALVVLCVFRCCLLLGLSRYRISQKGGSE